MTSQIRTLSGHLTPQPSFARLKVAAGRASAWPVSRAEVAELADAHGSGPCTRKGVGVRVPSSAPTVLKRCALSSLHGAFSFVPFVPVAEAPRLSQPRCRSLPPNPAHLKQAICIKYVRRFC